VAAKEQVASHLEYPAEFVQLLFAWRVVQNPFVLDNLDIGAGIIAMYFRKQQSPQF
jgi:hypothetical protein